MSHEIATVRRTLAPTTFAEAYQFAEQIAKSSMVPAEYRGKPENILLAIQWGQELGIAPLQAIQNIAVINGKPSVYGDTLIALVRGSPVCDDVIETFEGEGDKFTAICEARRRGKAAVVAQFSVADAKLAGLWGKAGPWKQYPRRMLQMRARGFALRDAFPDVLRGVITMEEAADYPVNVNTRAPVDATPRADLDRFAAPAETEILDAETGEILDEISDDDLWPAADAAAMRGTQAFRDWWKGLPTAKRDLLRASLPQYQATATAADRGGAEEDDPFGLPPLPAENSPPAIGAVPPKLGEGDAPIPSPTPSPTDLPGGEAENLTVPLPVRPTTDKIDYFARQLLALIAEAPATPQRLALIRRANERGIALLKGEAVAQYDEVMAALAKPARVA